MTFIKITPKNMTSFSNQTKVHTGIEECPIMEIEETSLDLIKLVGISKLSKSYKKIILFISHDEIEKETYLLKVEVPNSIDFIRGEE